MVTKDNIQETLLNYRSKKEKTQEYVSKKTGVTVQTISAIESGSRKIQSLTLYKFQQFFEKPENRI